MARENESIESFVFLELRQRRLQFFENKDKTTNEEKPPESDQ